MEIKSEWMGKCGFYCGSCPAHASGNCSGCMNEHKPGDCFTRDCVIASGHSFCGECEQFPCDTICQTPHTSVLDKAWLLWRKASDTNR